MKIPYEIKTNVFKKDRVHISLTTWCKHIPFTKVGSWFCKKYCTHFKYIDEIDQCVDCERDE